MNGPPVRQQPRRSFGVLSPALGEPLRPSARQLFGPRAVCLDSQRQTVWVSDTGHHRLLQWSLAADSPDAQCCLGQSHWDGEARNGGQAAGSCSFSTPVAVCALGAGLAVADSWNHRILIWHEPPSRWSQAADLVLGQPDFESALGNRGSARAAADSLFWPSGLLWDGERLLVADTGNRRVLIWQGLPRRNGQGADGVLGQHDMQSRDQGAGRDLDAVGMVWPHALVRWRGGLVVADAGANRLMLWHEPPGSSGQPCDQVLGQPDCSARLHNRGHYKARADSLAMPYGLAAWGDYLFVADTANSRLLIWREPAGAACAVHGQRGFAQAGDNRWGPPLSDSLCWPYGLGVADGHLVIADTGNNRVQLWDVEALLRGL